jgi:organic hydroperoxide reductase OsmC/OhrA
MKHSYKIKVEWVGNQGLGTVNYNAYNRNYLITSDEKQEAIKGSSDSAFLGDQKRYNPEELFLSSISACHMLWYLHLCAVHQIIVTAYSDYASGIMEETIDGSGRFISVTLHPSVKVADAEMIEKANELHDLAHKMCFIANSCNFKISHVPIATCT